jgi:predicted  nucleic acid-binding Zn-ribbon protein
MMRVKATGIISRGFSTMKKLLVVVLVLLVGIAALGYWRGWFSVTSRGDTDVQVDQAKFKRDKDTFSTTVGEKTRALKSRITSLWTKTEGLTGDEKTRAKKELGELEKKHERLERQLKELEDAGTDKFESIKQDLSRALEDVEKEIEALTQKLAKGKDK